MRIRLKKKKYYPINPLVSIKNPMFRSVYTDKHAVKP